MLKTLESPTYILSPINHTRLLEFLCAKNSFLHYIHKLFFLIMIIFIYFCSCDEITVVRGLKITITLN